MLTNDDWTEESGEKVVASWLRLKASEGFHAVAVCAQTIAGEHVAADLRLPPHSHPGEEELACCVRSAR